LALTISHLLHKFGDIPARRFEHRSTRGVNFRDYGI
jgi:hypothetical protein